jgi:outer membrane receptor protein involved in Fe transport
VKDVGLNPSIVPDNMAKLGTGYTWEGGSVGVFYSYFSTPPNITSPLVVNPRPEDIHLVSINMRMDVSKMLGLSQKRSILTLKIENLFDEEIYAPTFAYTGSPNSFPFGPGITCYGGLQIDF